MASSQPVLATLQSQHLGVSSALEGKGLVTPGHVALVLRLK